MLLPSLVGIYFLSPDYQSDVVDFCNKSEIGDKFNSVIVEARNIEFQRVLV